MSEWTVATLKEHTDVVFAERDLRYEQRFQASEQRLTGMNEFRGTVNDVLGTCITRREALAYIIAACTVTATIIEVISFFARK